MSFLSSGRALRGLALVLAVGLCGAARAGSFEVSPVRMTLQPGRSIGAFTVHNSGTAPTTVQVKLVRWSQHDGRNIYKPTHDLLASPPLFRIAPGHEQVIRVGLRTPSTGPIEQAYRMFLTEVPPPRRPGFNGLAVALQLSIPIFARGAQPVSPTLAWKVVRQGPRHLTIEARDTGTGHVKVNGIRIDNARGQGLVRSKALATYLLPNRTHHWQLTTQRPIDAGATVHIHARTDSGEINADATVSAP